MRLNFPVLKIGSKLFWPRNFVPLNLVPHGNMIHLFSPGVQIVRIFSQIMRGKQSLVSSTHDSARLPQFIF